MEANYFSEFYVQVNMGSVGSSHEDLCVSMAAEKRGPHGGLCRMLGPCITIVDSGSCFGAAYFSTTTERGLCGTYEQFSVHFLVKHKCEKDVTFLIVFFFWIGGQLEPSD